MDDEPDDRDTLPLIQIREETGLPPPAASQVRPVLPAPASSATTDG